jgi:hypothetical protein
MTNIKFPSSYNRQLSFSLVTLLSVAGISGCDSLWSPFTTDDPNSCASRPTVNPCNDQQTCNTATGKCEPVVSPPTLAPLVFGDINPNISPASGGGNVVVSGQGFTRSTVFRIAGQPLQSSMYIDNEHIAGTIPRSPNRCGLVDISLTREDSANIQKSNLFRYSLKPLNVRPAQFSHQLSSAINQIQVANMDGDANQILDILISHNNGFTVLFSQGLGSRKESGISIPTGIGERIAIAKTQSVISPEIVLFNKSNKKLESYSLNRVTLQYSLSKSTDIIGDVINIIPIDTNKDGTDEILLGISNSPGSSTLALYSLIPAVAQFQPTSSINFTSDLGPLTTGDFDGDGITDLALATGTKWRLITMDQATGSIKMPQITDIGSIIKSMTAGDFNGDGKSDLAIYTADNGNVFVLSHNGAMLTLKNTITVGVPPVGFTPSMQSYDINCDGLVDIAINQPTTNGTDLKLSINNANNGGFDFIQSSSMPNMFLKGNAFLITDYNQDSLPEIFAASYNSATTIASMEAYIP